MVIVDTSVWVDIFRDHTGSRRRILSTLLDPEEVVLTPFTEMALLQGSRDDMEWSLLKDYLDGQEYVEPRRTTWAAAARIFYALRRLGKTVRSPIDCCIAQIALENQLLLFHRDRDFETISGVRSLCHHRIIWP